MGLLNSLSTYFGAKQQAKSADRAAEIQSEGVKSAQDETRRATAAALPFITGQQASQPSGVRPPNQAGEQYNQSGPQSSTLGFIPSIRTLQDGGQNAISKLVGSQQEQESIIGRTFDEAGNLISPLANQSQSFTDEQASLLGLLGPQAQSEAMARVSDPLVAEQEQALLRNFGAYGGVAPSGNVLSALADQTRNRVQSNIGSRLQQLQSSGSPALNALQMLTQQTINKGQAYSGVESAGGTAQANLSANLAQQIAAAQQQGGTVAANTLIGQGSELSQLAQNLGTARAGGAAFKAGQIAPLTQGVNRFTEDMVEGAQLMFGGGE